MFDENLSVGRAFTLFLSIFMSEYTDEFQNKILSRTISQQHTNTKKYTYILSCNLFINYAMKLYINTIQYKL